MLENFDRREATWRRESSSAYCSRSCSKTDRNIRCQLQRWVTGLECWKSTLLQTSFAYFWPPVNKCEANGRIFRIPSSALETTSNVSCFYLCLVRIRGESISTCRFLLVILLLLQHKYQKDIKYSQEPYKLTPKHPEPKTKPQHPEPKTKPHHCKMSYTIVSGDTFWSIAQAHGTTVGAIEAANPGVNPSSLQVGQVINLPGAEGSPSPSGGSSVGGGYVAYSGPASGFPDPSTWAHYNTLWSQNSTLMALNDSPSEVGFIKAAIEQVAPESGIDARAILCIIMQESGGNVRVGTTSNGVGNPGIMQSHAGVAFNPSDPQGSILQMVRDGTEGTSSGDGLKQLYARYNNYYEAFRGYNSGSVDQNDLNDPVGATGTYVQSVANRLMGHTWAGM